MKVFVSSTCYDLIDLRSELFEDLRDLGVDAYFSDIKESSFQQSDDTLTNSVESCIANLANCDIAIFVLSQRYGPSLKRQYGALSATHYEYMKAKEGGKPIWLFVRDRLFADWSSWKLNNKSYSPAFAEVDPDYRLFNFLTDHQPLHGGSNNWYWTFENSCDLRRHIRQRLSPAAFHATAERLIDSGNVPIVVVNGQGNQWLGDGTKRTHQRITVVLQNAGPVPAIQLRSTIIMAYRKSSATQHRKYSPWSRSRSSLMFSSFSSVSS